jgi:hypothetical protein
MIATPLDVRAVDVDAAPAGSERADDLQRTAADASTSKRISASSERVSLRISSARAAPDGGRPARYGGLVVGQIVDPRGHFSRSGILACRRTPPFKMKVENQRPGLRLDYDEHKKARDIGFRVFRFFKAATADCSPAHVKRSKPAQGLLQATGAEFNVEAHAAHRDRLT